MQKDSQQVNYFRIGSFVLLGIALIVIGIMFIGSRLFLEKKVYIETYFNDSIQGLSDGSPVKYRGMEIGYVKKIGFIDDVYQLRNHIAGKTYDRYIYVEMAITSGFLAHIPPDVAKNVIAEDIKRGLRIKLSLQGLTGAAYLEIDYLDPQKNPPLSIDWSPNYYYIPSATSTLARFSDSLQHILEQVKQVNIDKIVKDIHGLTISTHNLVNNAKSLLNNVNYQFIDTVNNLEDVSSNLRILSEQIKAAPSSIIFSKPPPKLDLNRL